MSQKQSQPTDRMVSSRVAASILGVAEQTLAKWRYDDRPDRPAEIRFGRTIKYRESDLLRWIDAHVVTVGGNNSECK